ncbi:MAG: hypothetical protein ACJ71D_03425 [Nitrososphaera sp.]
MSDAHIGLPLKSIIGIGLYITSGTFDNRIYQKPLIVNYVVQSYNICYSDYLIANKGKKSIKKNIIMGPSSHRLASINDHGMPGDEGSRIRT